MRGFQERISRIECDLSLLAVFAQNAHCLYKRQPRCSPTLLVITRIHVWKSKKLLSTLYQHSEISASPDKPFAQVYAEFAAQLCSDWQCWSCSTRSVLVEAFSELQTATISFVMCVYLSVCMHGTARPLDRYSLKFVRIFKKSVDKFQGSLKRGKNTGTVHEDRYTFLITSRSFRFRTRNV